MKVICPLNACYNPGHGTAFNMEWYSSAGCWPPHEQEQQTLIAYASPDRREDKYLKDDSLPEALNPFRNAALGIANQFVKWGASYNDFPYMSMIAKHLKTGETNLQTNLNLHSDALHAMRQLRIENQITLRLVAVSDTPSQFIDLTQEEDIQTLLERHRIDNGRLYETELLTLSQNKGQIIKPKPRDILLFDRATPHLPEGILLPHRRIVQSAWIEMRLPPNWQQRIKSGDAPRL